MFKDKKVQLASLVAAVVVLLGGGLAYANYQEQQKQQKMDDNVQAAKTYLDKRAAAKKKFAAVDTAVISSTSAKSTAKAKVCTAAAGVITQAKEVGTFESNGYSEDNDQVKKAMAASNDYTAEQASKDIQNIADVCAQQVLVAKFVEDMNAASDGADTASKAFYQKSYEMASKHANELKKSCPFVYLNKAGQKICDKQVSDQENYAKANKILVDAMNAGQDAMSAAPQAMALLENMDKDLEADVYKQALNGQSASRENFVQKYVSIVAKRVQQL